MPRSFYLALALTAIVPATRAPADIVLRVDAGLSTGANDGSSWPNAYQGRLGLQNAITAAAALPPPVQIWVGQGTYTPAGQNGDRNASFTLADGIEILGGFQAGAISIDERNPASHPTILSADLNQNDQAQGPGGDNGRHVVRAVAANATAILDGFSIQGGSASGNDPVLDETGAGLYVDGGAPTIRRCIIRENEASKGGGAALLNSNATFEDCLFQSNTAFDLGAGLGNFGGGAPTLRRCTFSANICGTGGGIYNGPWNILDGSAGGAPTIEDCDFLGNIGQISAPSGIGLFDLRGAPRVSRCRFINNTTGGGGGGVYLAESSAIIVSCDFVGNVGSADGGGGAYVDGSFFATDPPSLATPAFTNCRFVGNNGAIFANFSGRCALTNCTFANNTVGFTTLIWPTILCNAGSTMAIRNCVIWGNQPVFGSGLAGILFGGGQITVDSSCVQSWDGSRPGTGTIGADPLFINANGQDGVRGTIDDDVRLSPGSPCINTGNTSMVPADLTDLDGDGQSAEVVPFDLGGSARITGCEVDMGAYESPGLLPHSGDANGDGSTTLADLPAFVSALLAGAPDCILDLNADSHLDGRDILPFVGALLSP